MRRCATLSWRGRAGGRRPPADQQADDEGIPWWHQPDTNSGSRDGCPRTSSQDFEDFEVTEAPVETVLLGEVVDGAHLHGVLARLESFGLQIVSLRAIPE